MNKIVVLGAFDRYNYGDLLFPVIIEQQLKTYRPDLDIAYFGIVESNLSEWGGKPTQDITAFYAQCESGEKRVNVIIAGGEAVAVTWHSLLVALNKKYHLIRRYQHHLEKFVDLNQLGRKLLKGKTTLPFVMNNSDFKNVDHVIFNSLGGSEIPESTFKKVKDLKAKLQQVDYFSVRDRATQQNLANQQVTTQLFPDSAVLMSKFYPVEVLRDRYVSEEVKAYVAQQQGNYLFFQVNKNHAKQNEEIIAEQLNKIYQYDQTAICLCPIGTASNHHDDEALRRIQPHLKVDGHLFGQVSIWDVMYLIASSKCYVGTSLHGAITAMSFAVPYIGLRVKKLDSYLATWGVKELNGVVQLPQIFERYKQTLDMNAAALEDSKRLQIQEIEKSFENMRKLLMPE